MGGTMRRGLAAMVAAAMLVVLVAGCGEAPEIAEPESPARIQASVERTHRQWAGTTEDRDAAQVVRAYALNGKYSDCMAAKGYDGFDWRRGIDPAEPSQDTGLTGLLEPFGTHQVRDEVLHKARAARYEYESNHPERFQPVWNDAVVAAIDKCLAKADSADDEELDALTEPDGLEDLTQAWYDAAETRKVLLWDATSPEAAEYVACMTQRGYPPAKGEWESAPHIRQLILDRVARKAPTDWRVLTDPEKRAASPKWQAFVKAEQAMLDADETCRVPIVNARIADVKELQDAFGREHSDQISEVADGWTRIRARAGELGWSPDEPFAGYPQD